MNNVVYGGLNGVTLECHVKGTGLTGQTTASL